MIEVFHGMARFWWEMTHRPPESMFIWVLVAVLVDIVNLILETKREVCGHGSSGIYVITPFIYVVFTLISSRPIPFDGSPQWLFRVLNISGLIGFHLACSIFVPKAMGWLVRIRRRSGSE